MSKSWPVLLVCPSGWLQQEQLGQMHQPLLCEANRWHAAFCGKLNIYSQHCLRPFEGFVDPPTTAAHMTLIAVTGSSLVHGQMSELLWQNCRLRSQMMRWLHTKTPEHVRHSLTDTCTQVAWSAVPHTDMPFPAMQRTRQERFHLMFLGTRASDVGFKSKATAENILYMDVHTQTHTVQSHQIDRASVLDSSNLLYCVTYWHCPAAMRVFFTLSVLQDLPELFPAHDPVWVKHVLICARAWKYFYHLLFLRCPRSFILRVGREAKHWGDVYIELLCIESLNITHFTGEKWCPKRAAVSVIVLSPCAGTSHDADFPPTHL